MKVLFENWRGYLKEIGDASLAPYPFELYDSDESEVRYIFSTDEYDYLVVFDSRWGGVGRGWDISYQDANTGAIAETDEGNALRTLSTIVAIIKEFITTPELNQGIKRYQFMGVPKFALDDSPGRKWDEDEYGRTKLYMAYLKKNMPPGTKIDREGANKVVFELPADEQEMPQAAQ